MKLSEKQKEVVSKMRNGAKLYFSSPKSGYYLYEENASGSYRVHRATIDNLVIKTKLICNDHADDGMLLTPLGKTIQL